MRVFIWILVTAVSSLGQITPLFKTQQLYQVTDCGPFTPTHMNKSGQIVGYAVVDEVSRLMLCDESGTRDVGAGGPAPGMFTQNSTPAMNDKADIVGVDASGGFLQYADGERVYLGSVVPVAINTARQIAGYMPVEGVDHAVLWHHGMVTDLGLLLPDTAVPSTATDINDEGVVVGYFGTYPYDTKGFYYDGAVQVIPYNTPEGRIVPLSVNNVGQIAGIRGFISGRLHPFVWESGVISSLPDRLGLFAEALSINEKGQVVGMAPGNWPNGADACLWTGGAQYDLWTLLQPVDSSYWWLSTAIEINVRGQIAVAAKTLTPMPYMPPSPTGPTHALLLTAWK